MNQSDKLVSVVVQAYNSSSTIIRTLDSIKSQTYPRIEIIISDDKSKDDTIDVVKQWIGQNERNFERIKLITTEKNTGIPGSNNRALKEIKGTYAEFLAADDCLLDGAIEEYVSFCEQNENVIPISEVELFSDDEVCDFSSVEKYCRNCYEFAKQDHDEQYRQLLIQNRIVAPAASFYPVKILRSLNGFDEAYRWMEDYPMNMKLLKKGYRFGYLSKKLIRYRISGSSITGGYSFELKRTEAKLFFREKMWYMIQFGMGWEAVKQSKSWIKVLLKRGN